MGRPETIEPWVMVSRRIKFALEQGMEDFQPGDVITYRQTYGDIKEYLVLNPVRTSTGKLRVRGPRGGFMTTWWTIADVEEYSKMGWRRPPILNDAQDKAFAFLTGFYGDCRIADRSYLPEQVKLVGIDEDGDERCRWWVGKDGKVRMAWDPDHAIDKYEEGK